MGYVSRNHSKYLIMAHLIFVCKYRKKLLVVLGSQMKQIIYEIAQEKGFEIVVTESDKDHIHLLVRYKSIQSVLEFAETFLERAHILE